MNPLEVSRGLKEGRIRLAGECNQCVYITEYDETGGRVETRVTRRWTAQTFLLFSFFSGACAASA